MLITVTPCVSEDNTTTSRVILQDYSINSSKAKLIMKENSMLDILNGLQTVIGDVVAEFVLYRAVRTIRKSSTYSYFM